MESLYPCILCTLIFSLKNMGKKCPLYTAKYISAVWININTQCAQSDEFGPMWTPMTPSSHSRYQTYSIPAKVPTVSFCFCFVAKTFNVTCIISTNSEVHHAIILTVEAVLRSHAQYSGVSVIDGPHTQCGSRKVIMKLKSFYHPGMLHPT